MNNDYQRIETAIRYIEQHYCSQPNLDRIALELGLSAYHFQRLFQRWAGISPKRFLQYLTLEHAKGLLKNSASVLDACFATGLSSAGRLYDHFVMLEAMTPGEYKRHGAGLTIYYGIHPSPFGDMLLAVTEKGLCGLWFLQESSPAQALSELHAHWGLAKQLNDISITEPFARRIFAQDSQPQSGLSVLVKGTNFQIQVWKALLRIPQGAVITYGQLAAKLGTPQAARAIGSAVGANAVAYLIPCHRVIRATGETGEYRWGPARKKAMLLWESAAQEQGHKIPY